MHSAISNIIKTVIILSLFISLSVIGCSKKNTEVLYTELLAKEEGSYYILYIDNVPKDQKNIKIPELMLMLKEPNRGTYFPNLDTVKEQYPLLKIKKVPVIMVYNQKNLVLETKDENKVKILLQDK